MLQTLHPYTPTAKTAEIMARYRPIAPKPQAANAACGKCGTGNSPGAGGGDEGSESVSGAGSGVSGSGSGSSPSSLSPTIRQSPYLRNVWPHLQSRPTRTRKRGRTSLGPVPPPAAFKRPRTLLQGLSPPFHITAPPVRTISIQGFAPTTLVTLPLLPTHPMQSPPDVIDLNKVAEIPEEKDLLAQLQKPTSNVISPTPNRLVSSTVSIRAVKLDDTGSSHRITLKKPEEIEKELESHPLPAFVSDSNNRVRLVNSSYQNMVGQPNCGWVESMVSGEIACRSICGNVVLDFVDLEDGDDDLRVCSGGFSCWARIEWGANGKKNVVKAFGEGMRVACESKDYKFAWRFHRRQGGAEVLQD